MLKECDYEKATWRIIQKLNGVYCPVFDFITLLLIFDINDAWFNNMATIFRVNKTTM